MSNDVKIIKKEIKDFLLINFGIIAFISVFLFLSSSKTNAEDLAVNFAALFMYIPAFSTIIVLKKISKYEFKPEIDKFFKVFAIATILRIIATIGESFLPNGGWLSGIIDTIVSAYLLYLVLVNSNEMKDINLCLGKNSKKVATVILIFAAIVFASNIPEFINGQVNSDKLMENMVMAIMSLIINFLIGFNLFFGEEFGWRYFLQPRLQKLCGKRIGVIILGFIWGIWHAPLCFTLYSPKTPLYCVAGHAITCIFLGIYFGYAYMKTENVWAPMLLHMVNNVIGIIFGGGYTTVYTWESFIYSILTYAILFTPFLLTKEYKSNKENKVLS
ncbi:MAG TPA: CPBP family intramembrane metalloprotease domain-containing protein [Terrisporobacter glycolicus]|uniref:CPBP family intramembrane glutamic endopeptidase n=1 Tax=Terrisporobacter TaxID=1505652 RepID=UPI000E89B73F|nr:MULTISPECIES: CPBP family intramembrane glutamic endopeptidase [Terrisporobacter]HBI94604.1 CPBP family intramembrane metalloprotease domain-containing protein [Terrisporobacter hibernicus]